MQPCSLRSAERPSTSDTEPFPFYYVHMFPRAFHSRLFFSGAALDVPSCRRRLRALGWAPLHLHLAGGFVPSALCPHGRAAARRGTVDFGVAGEVSQRLDPERSLASR